VTDFHRATTYHWERPMYADIKLTSCECGKNHAFIYEKGTDKLIDYHDVEGLTNAPGYSTEEGTGD
jgi:hypothetical protein